MKILGILSQSGLGFSIGFPIVQLIFYFVFRKFKHEVSSSGSSSTDEAENPSPKLVVKLAKKPPKLKGSSSALSDSSPEKTSLKAVTKPMTEPPKANIKTEAKSPQTIEKPKSPKAVAKIDKSPKAVARIDKSPKAVAKTDKSAKAVAKTKAESLESSKWNLVKYG